MTVTSNTGVQDSTNHGAGPVVLRRVAEYQTPVAGSHVLAPTEPSARAVKARKKSLPLSAAVGADPARAAAHFQDIEHWLADGLLDMAFPMNYTPDEVIFGDRLEAWLARDRRVRVVMGVQLGVAPDELRLRQLGLARETLGDLALFSYAGLFDSKNTVHEGQSEAERRARAKRRELLLPQLKARGSR
jgi:uncharacterized lipoprotein YddW (UPF0748 family)